MATLYAIEEIRKDVEEFTNVFFPTKNSFINHWSTDKVLEEVKIYSDEQVAASEIIGRTIISKRFAKKILSVTSKYQSPIAFIRHHYQSKVNRNGHGVNKSMLPKILTYCTKSDISIN